MSLTLPTEIVQSDKTPRTAVAFDRTSGVQQSSSTAREVNLIGMMLDDGTATPEIPYEILRSTDGESLFGKGSMLDLGIKAAFKANPFVKLTATAVADAGTQATTTVTFATTATARGLGEFWIGGVRVTWDIEIDDTASEIGDNFEAAVNANTSLPVTADNAAGTVTLEAKNGGSEGNGIALRGKLSPATAVIGTTIALAGDFMGATSAGTGEADIADALAACAGHRYHEVGVLLSDTQAGQDARDSVDENSDAEHGLGEFAHQVINSELSDVTDRGQELNGHRSQVAGINGSESWSPTICAALAAVMASEEVATRPLNTLVLKGILPPPVEKRWQRTETRNLLDNGCTPLVVLPGGRVAILRSVVTGVLNDDSNYDYSTLDITITRGFDKLRDDVDLMFGSKYPRARWANDDPDGLLPPDVATPEKVTLDFLDVLRANEAEGITANVEALKDQIVVEKQGTQCVFSIPAEIVDGMHEKLGSIVLIRKTVTSV